jgi:hypothetical protein
MPDGSDQQLLMKFDLDETWIENANQRGILLENVACHEFGHLLGLTHSQVQGALMAPYYNAAISTPQQNDDIPRILARYGPATAQPPVGPTPTPPVIPPVVPSQHSLVITLPASGASVVLDGQRIV